jgi:hypothetical protein
MKHPLLKKVSENLDLAEPKFLFGLIFFAKMA